MTWKVALFCANISRCADYAENMNTFLDNLGPLGQGHRDGDSRFDLGEYISLHEHILSHVHANFS